MKIAHHHRSATLLALITLSLSGCASWQPSQLLPDSWTSSETDQSTWQGTYQSQEQMGLITTLELNQDNSAKTIYSYTNGDPDLIETGRWRALNSQQLEVTMTTHQGHPLDSQRIYQFDPKTNQLIATQETVNGQSYSLGENGLVLSKQ
ncbi:TPA: hypothetical protein ACX6QD_001551 [Photobacterium damselae]